ncbi:hypothetical protein V6N12_003519 [Hibiscus sabdariffa]|uniref:Secreted protein n=1 Tax=Hibiscus sabdariffa TaxID=183260 RepID=A0ABR2ARI2_9ROSI
MLKPQLACMAAGWAVVLSCFRGEGHLKVARWSPQQAPASMHGSRLGGGVVTFRRRRPPQGGEAVPATGTSSTGARLDGSSRSTDRPGLLKVASSSMHCSF